MRLTMLGTGNTILKQIKAAGFDWMDIRHIFVTQIHEDQYYNGSLWIPDDLESLEI